MSTYYPRGGHALPGTSLEYHTGAWRLQRPLHLHRAAPCHAACPAGEDPQAYLARLDEGDPRAAWENLILANPLPAITGRVCPHPCEGGCNRAYYDEAIGIHGVERFLGDEAIRNDWAYPLTPLAPDAAPVAVVGAGPAGLSAAWHLRRLGHRVTLFEARPEAGGVCRSALPPYRLPRKVLDAEISRLLACDIAFEPRRRLGRDFTLDELRAGYRAVFLGPGTQAGRPWNVDGVTPRDLHHGLALLEEWIDVGKVPAMASVAIIGGGNTAIDLARVLKGSGVSEVHVITHDGPPGPDTPAHEVMPALAREIAQAIEEGVVIHPHRGVNRLLLRGERVVGIELVHMRKLARDNGRLERVAFEGTETVLHVDQVIPSIGQVVDPEGLASLLKGDDFLSADADTGRLAQFQDVHVGGDARGDHGTVAEAVGDGRRAALAIDARLRGRTGTGLANPAPVAFAQLNVNYFDHAPRADETILPIARRNLEREIAGGYDAGQAAAEAARCFSCGECLACDNCWTLCPDQAVLKGAAPFADGSRYLFDYDYCKGCGLCANECPSAYIVMEEESRPASSEG
jgi:formate dehydrogenase (NADP+) beta subunit